MFGTFGIFVYWVLNCISKQHVLVALVTTHISWQACLIFLSSTNPCCINVDSSLTETQSFGRAHSLAICLFLHVLHLSSRGIPAKPKLEDVYKYEQMQNTTISIYIC